MIVDDPSTTAQRASAGMKGSIQTIQARKVASPLWLRLALAFCFGFGLLLIANVQLAGDGDWFWYAKLLRGGTHLYSTLKLTLQPLFILETAWFQDIFGEGWIVSKIAPVLHLAALALGMFLLVRRSDWSERQKAVVLVCAFFVGIRLEAYRFDDYHVLADCFVLFSTVLILTLHQARSFSAQLTTVVALGSLAGLTFTTRPNDGLALACFSALAITCFAKSRRAVSVGVFAAAVAIAVGLIVSLTGDSLAAWARDSLLHAGGLKGGSTLLLSDPFRVLMTAGSFLWSAQLLKILGLIAVALSWSLLIASFKWKRLRPSIARLLLGLLIIAFCVFMLGTDIISGSLMLTALAGSVFVVYLGALYVAAKAFLHLTTRAQWARWRPQDILLLLPFVMLASTSLSSGGNFYDLYMPVALLIIVAPIVNPAPLKYKLVRRVLVAAAAVLAVSGICYRVGDPNSWQSYTTYPLLQNRALAVHRNYGPMVIDKPLLKFIGQICALVDDGAEQPQLLSIPFPYANYYCAIPPWHGYVQTWFDSTSKEVVDNVLDDLEVAPPKWVLYQRQTGTLAYHEAVFNNGQVLPQRALDDFIMTKVSDGEWKAVFQERSGPDSLWILARTQTVVSSGLNLLPRPDAEQGLSNWQITQNAPTWREDSHFAGDYYVSNVDGSSAESILSHGVSFPRSGSVMVGVRIAANGFPAKANDPGYAVDVFDATADIVVGSLGFSSANDVAHDYKFVAKVDATHQNLVRLRFQAATGAVQFSRLSTSTLVTEPGGANSSGDESLNIGSVGWRQSLPTPSWSYDPRSGGAYVVSSDNESAIVSNLNYPISFDQTGTVAIGVTIGANSMKLAGGFGYVVDLFDSTTGAITGSLGIPARASPPRRYSFTARVRRGDAYSFRLRFEAASATVSFSNIKIEYGTVPTGTLR